MRPILFRLGPLVVHSYPALVNLGVILAAALVLVLARRRGISAGAMVDVLLGGGFGALILGRVVYVAVRWDYYGHHVGRAAQPWDGGLAWQGALVGVILGSAAVCLLRRMPLLSVLDIMSPGGPLLSIFAWLACFAVGCAWGIESYPHQRLLWTVTLDLPDLYGIRQPRVAVQLLGAAWGVVVLVTLLILNQRRHPKGALFGMWLMLHGLGCFIVGFLRADEWPLLLGWRLDQILNLCLSVVGAAALLTTWLINRRPGSPASNQTRTHH